MYNTPDWCVIAFKIRPFGPINSPKFFGAFIGTSIRSSYLQIGGLYIPGVVYIPGVLYLVSVIINVRMNVLIENQF
jgi:hypothetical protein